jgi:hypothetical protein
MPTMHLSALPQTIERFGVVGVKLQCFAKRGLCLAVLLHALQGGALADVGLDEPRLKLDGLLAVLRS